MATKDNFIEELKLKNDIVEVVSSYATLTRSGNNYWARCPFPGHNERTASFSVNETGQFCHCFGCKRGGDVITFVKEVENIDFMEAVTILAKRVGLEVPNDRENYSKKDDGFNREKMQKLLKDTALFYVHNLKNAPKHLEYLQKRNINKDCLKDFGIGASLDYDSLPKYLLEKGYTQEEMLSIGVVQKSEKGRLYDFQAERLIIPIIDNYNNVIAFGGRFLGK
ncbi:MAG: DNA primase, partial [Clostridia bacterium]|nr:DNA primase [Clostridia bacterium]